MALVSATEMINKAHEGHYAIPAFNTNNLEWTQCSLSLYLRLWEQDLTLH